jgi:sensor histidine kinase YesM
MTTTYSTTPAPKLTKRYLGIAIAITFVANCLVGLLFAATYSVFTVKGMVIDMIYSHSIGWLIMIFLLGGRHLLWPHSVPSKLGLAMLAIVGASAAWVLGNYIGAAINGHEAFKMAKFSPTLMIPGIVMTAIGSVLGMLFFSNREHFALLKAKTEQQAREAETVQRQLIGAQLSTLQAQLEPHMLFNTLANLRALIGIDPTAAQLMLDKLNSFLRATLSSTRQTHISLEQEFQLVNDYLDLMKIRMGERLTFELDLPSALQLTMVPPLLLQPVVENAIKHGIEPFTGNGSIKVSATSTATSITLSVRDTSTDVRVYEPLGTHTSPLDQGFGLAQLKERLDQLYGGKATLSVSLSSPQNPQTLIEVTLPC